MDPFFFQKGPFLGDDGVQEALKRQFLAWTLQKYQNINDNMKLYNNIVDWPKLLWNFWNIHMMNTSTL